MKIVTEREIVDHYQSQTREEILDDEKLWDDGTMSRVYGRLLCDAQFIDFGCGYGRFIPCYENLGLSPENYLGIDITPIQLETARDLYPKYTFEHCSVADVGARHPNRFNAFICLCVFMFISNEQMPVVLRSMRASLKLGAVGLISTPYGKEPMENMYGHTVNRFLVSSLTTMCQEAGFEPVLDAPFGDMVYGTLTAI